MARDGSGVYSIPNDDFVANTTIESSKIDENFADLVQDANTARPIVAGGTGATTAVAANDALNTTSSNIASATTTDLSGATGVVVNITGTTTITGFGTESSGAERILIFEGALTLTHNGTSLILPGAANITTAAGDVAHMRSLGSGNWKCVGYLRANSAPFAFPILAPAGTEGAPSYSFADDSNSGFYSSGTDEVSLTLGGTDRVTFSTSLMTIATDVLVDNDALRFVAGNDPLYQTTLDITSSLSANRTLSINAGDANHTLDISGAPTNVVIASGTYTPTLTNVANVAASVANAFRWLRVGNTVWVDGILTVDPTTTATLTTVGLSLPVASNFASSAQLSGVGAAYTIANEAWGFSANATDDRATMQCICATASNHAVSVAFSYQVI